jgi:putative peptide zinc metalloprotease protein
VRDELSGHVHRLSPTAHRIVARMDGSLTIDELWALAAQELGDNAPTQDEVLQLVSQLHGSDLLICDTLPDAAELFERHAKQERSKILQFLLNPLSPRIPLWDPDRFLEHTLPWVRPFFGWLGAALWLALVLGAALTAARHWPELADDVGDRILAADNLVLMSLVYPVVKLLHELGHGYAAKAFGAEVHEIGVMLLMGYPTPYVDASGSSGFPSKYRRAVVGAAGVAVELALAALALNVWALVEPGVLRSVCFNVMVIAGVSTVLFNGNPLMRYDGYYVLTDLIEVPNLAARAGKYCSHLVDKHIFAAKNLAAFPGLMPGERLWFVFYAPASFIYRLVVQVGIAFFLASHLFFIGVAIAAWSLTTSFIVPLHRGLAHVFTGGSLRESRGRAVALTCGGGLALLIVLFLIPAPLHTTTEGVVWLPETAILRAGTDGLARRLLTVPGSVVETGDAVVESDEPELEAKLEVLRWQVAELESRLAAQEFANRVEAEITRFELRRAEGELAVEAGRADRLVARSRARGTLAVPKSEDLVGRYFHEGDVLGYVIPPSTRLVRATVSQDDIDLVRHHLQAVEVKSAEQPAAEYTAHVVREVPSGQSELPSKALGSGGGGQSAVDPRDPKGEKTLERFFQVDLEAMSDLPTDAFGSRVYVRFEHDWEPLGLQLYRRLHQLLLSRLDA